MRWGKGIARYRMPRRPLHVVAAFATLTGGATIATHALADIIRFTPALLLEQVLTDNVRGQADDRDADGITTVGVRLDAEYETSRIQLAALGDAFYNEYWATDEFDGANANGTVAGRLVVLEDRLVVDGLASRQEVLLAPDDTGGTGLSTGDFTSNQTTYAFGPLLTLNVFDLADLSVRGTYASVMFEEPQAGPLLVPIEDIVAKSAAARITTGERHARYELIGTAEYLETDTGFRQRNAVGHVLLHLTPRITAIGRYGYERIEDPSIQPIKGPRWAAGARYGLSDNSFIQLEFGERFGSTNWSGEASVLVSPRVRFEASYTDTLLPGTLLNLRDFEDLFDAQGNLDLQAAPELFVPDLTLTDQVVRQKDLNTRTSYTYGLRTFGLIARHSEQEIQPLADTEKVLTMEFDWRETMSRSLTGLATVSFSDYYDTGVGQDPFRQYRAEIGFTYLYATDLTFTGEYLWALNDEDGADSDSQLNVVRFGMVKTY